MLDTKLVYQDLAARSPDGERFRLEPDTSITNWMLGAITRLLPEQGDTVIIGNAPERVEPKIVGKSGSVATFSITDATGLLNSDRGVMQRADAVILNGPTLKAPQPEVLFAALSNLIRTGVVVLYWGDVLVRQSDFEWRNIMRSIMNRGMIPYQTLVEPGKVLRQSLLLKDLPVEREGLAHDLGMFAQVLQSGAWELMDAEVHPADGCLHVLPENLSAEESKRFVQPEASIDLMKIGLVLRHVEAVS